MFTACFQLPVNNGCIMGKTSYNSGLHIVALPKRWCDKYGLAVQQPVNDVSSKLNISSCSLGILNGLEITIDTDLSQQNYENGGC